MIYALDTSKLADSHKVLKFNSWRWVYCFVQWSCFLFTTGAICHKNFPSTRIDGHWWTLSRRDHQWGGLVTNSTSKTRYVACVYVRVSVFRLWCVSVFRLCWRRQCSTLPYFEKFHIVALLPLMFHFEDNIFVSSFHSFELLFQIPFLSNLLLWFSWSG